MSNGNQHNERKASVPNAANRKETQMKRMKPLLTLATALCLTSQGLVLDLRAADANQTNVTVEVLIFSGRPNPTWQLQNTNQLNMLKANLKILSTAFEKEPAEWSRLGFGGFRIRGGDALGLPGEIRIYQGAIKTGQGKEAKYLQDSAGLEQSLINEAKRQALAPPVKEAIANYENVRKSTH